MELTLYQVDAFTSAVFGGNPAAVIPLSEWLPTALMQSIAEENNLSETAFFVAQEDQYHIRWFAPQVEIPLCGHATLASAHIIFEYLQHPSSEIVMQCGVGTLKVRKTDQGLTLNFPTQQLEAKLGDEAMSTALGKTPKETYANGPNYVLVYETEQDIIDMQPNFSELKKLAAKSVNVTAPGNEVDFVSRFFAPKIGIDEDPVTGSAHTRLIPYWANKLNKTELKAMQLSARKGELTCLYLNDRVEMTGQAVTYLIGKITL